MKLEAVIDRSKLVCFFFTQARHICIITHWISVIEYGLLNKLMYSTQPDPGS